MDGADRTERTERIVERIPGRHLGNPERTLRRFRIKRVTIEGAISGEVASVREVPVVLLRVVRPPSGAGAGKV